MFTLSISSLATLYIQVPVSATVNGAGYNPTGDVTQMAFLPGDVKPGSGDWHTGGWDTAPGPVYLAQCLVGPSGGVSLPTGTYTVWLRITDNPEQPVSVVGSLTIE